MATTSGTATDYSDLLDKLVTFVTSSGSMGSGNEWAAARYTSGDQAILQGPGSGGSDNITVGIKLFSDAGGAYYNWRLMGATGYDSGQPFETQPGGLARPVMPLWNASIPYWFVANARRIIVVAKVSTVYMTCYLGLLNPYATPGEYPYPLFIGGCMAWDTGQEPAVGNTNWRFSYNGNEMSSFWIGNDDSSASVPGDYQGFTGRLRKADGTWVGFATTFGGSVRPGNFGDQQGGVSSNPVYGDHFIQYTPAGGMWPYCMRFSNLRPNLDGSYPAFPITLFDGGAGGGYPDSHGDLDGIFATTGIGLAAEDTVTIASTTYLAVQDVFRTTRESYCLVRLS